jgi:hypothetical protein
VTAPGQREGLSPARLSSPQHIPPTNGTSPRTLPLVWPRRNAGAAIPLNDSIGWPV